MKRKTEIVIGGVILTIVIGAALMAYQDRESIGPQPGLRIVANCKNGQFDIPWKGEMFVPSVQAGYKPEAVIPIPPNCER